MTFCWLRFIQPARQKKRRRTEDGSPGQGRSWAAIWPEILLWRGINLLWIVGSASVPNGNVSFRTVRDGTYRITDTKSGKALTAVKEEAGSGVKIVARAWREGADQKWELIEIDSKQLTM